MFGKRLGGLLLGFVLGVIPLLNALICVVMSFVQKRRRLGILFIVLGGATIGSLIGISNVDKQRKLLNEQWEPAFYRRLESTNMPPDVMSDRDKFASEVRSVLDTVTKELIQQHSEVKDLFKTGRDGKISIDNDVWYFYEGAYRNIYVFYRNRVEKETEGRRGRNIRNIPFGETQEEREYTRKQMGAYFKEAIDDKLKAREMAFNALFALGFICSLIGSIALGWHAFAPAEDQPVRINPPRFDLGYNSIMIPYDNVIPDVNINTAGENELSGLPGVNLILAKAIIAERTRNGYFIDVFDLEQRMGFSQEQTGNLMLNTSFEVNMAGNQQQRAPERREAPEKKDDKGKDMGTGKGRRIEF
ncbi:helix-hairpin-helix domain-containing protein [Chitinophaga sp. G-6-1-13]|uniref:Helix-hairpin-helix domain-containing protein n=1 Tax=Chitinophaga fulva TaxID=2728842 RepID=A0A848GSJ7_9BACT|nr:helix-hairpin-helix domain-containing protein [Chitinophaga fulva]NML41017.1 helix-hairpin-helix domain-containing protein [Chitinophaga fulva]